MCGVFTAVACGGSGRASEPRHHPGVGGGDGRFQQTPALLRWRSLPAAFCGATLVWLYFCPHWRETPDPDSQTACFCTAPAIRSPISNLFCEAVGTFVLVLVASAIGSKVVAAPGPAPGLSPYLVGCLVWAIGLSLGGTTGYAINPARDLGPRIAHSLCRSPRSAIRIGATPPCRLSAR